MQELGYVRQIQLYNFKKQENAKNINEQKIENINANTKSLCTIDTLLDKVEDGDVSILAELGIVYTESQNETGDKKISFKYEGTRYTVNFIDNVNKDESLDTNTRRQNFDDGSYSIYETDENGHDLKRTNYNANGSIKDTLEFTYNEDGTVMHTLKNANGITTQITHLNKYGKVIHSISFKDTTNKEKQNTHRQDNEDGSYTIYEYSADGSSLLKKTEYDKDGKITYEFSPQGNDSYSDKYYTYENGNLVQIQETIQYNDGNYTYIFTDGNGNLKEEQKVIHNELGGLTFDSTFGNGTRWIMVCDAENKTVNETYYYENDKKTEEYSYNPSNPDLYTVITKNAEGRIISETEWESYTYTDDNGMTYYGSHKLKTINYNENGNITDIFRFNHKDYFSIEHITDTDPQFKDELENLAKWYQKQGDEISTLIYSLDAPIPPSASDFTKPDGSADEQAYAKAMHQYDEQKNTYQSKINELNKKTIEIQKKFQQVNKQIKELELKAKIENIENTINGLENVSNINNESLSTLKTKLENIKKNLLDLPSKKLEVQNKMQNIYYQILNMQVPTPPSVSDYTKPDGSADEKAYGAALNDYENQKYEHNREISQLEATKAILHNELSQIDMEIEKYTNELNQLENLLHNN